MGTVAWGEEEVHCADGAVVSVGWLCDVHDLDGGDHVQWCQGRHADHREFCLSVMASTASPAWIHRLYDAIAAHPDFRASLVGDVEADASFVVPNAPSRDMGAVGRLVRKGSGASFKDYVGVRSGRDAQTAMRLPALREALGEARCTDLAGRMGGQPDAEVAKAMRWVLRGLPVPMAVRKVEVDREVAASATGRR